MSGVAHKNNTHALSRVVQIERCMSFLHYSMNLSILFYLGNDKSRKGTGTETPRVALIIISPKLFLDQLNAWKNRNLFPERSAKFYSALSKRRGEDNGVPRVGAVHRRKRFCKQRKWFYLGRLSWLGARFHDFFGVDWFARWYISFLGEI